MQALTLSLCFGILVALTQFFCVSGISAAEEADRKSEPVSGAQISSHLETWKDPETKPRAALLCLHGLGLHKGTFEAFGKRMAKAGIVTYAMDIRGFGSWLGPNARRKIDFKQCLEDVSDTLSEIHRENPGLPVIVMGESMGGAIALRAAALHPDQVAGLISSVPSGERFNSGSEKFKVAMHALTEGFDKPMSVHHVVNRATKKSDLRVAWTSDPQARLMLTPHELIEFQHFMDENFEYAKKIERTPVLFVQGCQDRLVRPAGTWDLFDYLKTPDRDRVFSTHAEHLIFEESQFNDDDIYFVLTWLDKNVIGKLASATPVAAVKPAKPANAAASTPTVAENQPLSMDYWIELFRNGKYYRCNNKTEFRSGDGMRFHFIPHTDGYAYILLTAGTKGDRAVLFPAADSGMDNHLQSGRDYVLPSKAWLWFDETPGIERMSLVFSRTPLDAMAFLKRSASLVAYVSPDRTGSKDMVPTRMELSWDDPAPVIMPENIREQLVSGSVVKVRRNDSEATLALEIALEHK